VFLFKIRIGNIAMKKYHYLFIIIFIFALKAFSLELTIRNATGKSTFVSIRINGQKIYAGIIAKSSPLILNASAGTATISYKDKNGAVKTVRRKIIGHFMLIVLR
jgi:hypothetical protein